MSLMSLLISVLGIILTIFFVVGIHEAAHFAMARLLGVKVLRFSIGFGKALLTWHDRSGTEYVLAPIPLGGYVKLYGEEEDKDIPPDMRHLAYHRQPYYKKFLIVLAGPAINLISAFVLYWLIFTIGFTTIKPIIGKVDSHSIAEQAGLKSGQEIVSVDNEQTNGWTGILLRLIAHIGNQDQATVGVTSENKQFSTHSLDLTDWKMDELKPDPFSSLGMTPYEPDIPLVVGVIQKRSPAEKAGIQIGDHLLALDKARITSWDQLINTVMKMPGQLTLLTIKRHDKTMIVPLTIGVKHTWTWKRLGFIGIGPDFEWPPAMLMKIQYAPLAAAGRAWQEMVDFTYFNLLLIGKLFIGKLSLYALGGPITIFESAGQALNSGYIAFLGFLAFISISIGIVNVLPIPGLDGGHLLIQTIEVIIRRPLPNIIIVNLYRLGFVFLLFVLFQALVNDMLRLY